MQKCHSAERAKQAIQQAKGSRKMTRHPTEDFARDRGKVSNTSLDSEKLEGWRLEGCITASHTWNQPDKQEN